MLKNIITNHGRGLCGSEIVENGNKEGECLFESNRTLAMHMSRGLKHVIIHPLSWLAELSLSQRGQSTLKWLPNTNSATDMGRVAKF